MTQFNMYRNKPPPVHKYTGWWSGTAEYEGLENRIDVLRRIIKNGSLKLDVASVMGYDVVQELYGDPVEYYRTIALSIVRAYDLISELEEFQREIRMPVQTYGHRQAIYNYQDDVWSD